MNSGGWEVILNFSKNSAFHSQQKKSMCDEKI